MTRWRGNTRYVARLRYLPPFLISGFISTSSFPDSAKLCLPLRLARTKQVTSFSQGKEKLKKKKKKKKAGGAVLLIVGLARPSDRAQRSCHN